MTERQVTHQQLDVMTGVDRRSFLSLGGTAALAATGAAPLLRAGSPAWFAGYPFTLGVASGDPLPDGVVLWTRLAAEPLAVDGHGGMPDRRLPVGWEIATDENFKKRVQTGTATAVPEFGHSVHVEVTGLEPAREYFYRFRAGSEISPAGRTKTAPAPGASVPSLAFALASCQAWYEGFYTAYQRMVADDLDFVVHLGDYIYEYGVGPDGGVRGVQLPAQYGREAMNLVEYRNRHALYRTDTHLQAAHASFPWIVANDDHEVENNWAGDISQEDDEPDQDPAVFRQRRAAAYQAYYEHMPLRHASKPDGPDIALYRRLTFGDLVQFNVLDTRQYRSDQACGDGRQVGCEERLDPARSITGDAQEKWLLDGLEASPAIWNVLAQQVFMCQLDHDPDPPQAFSMDIWDGYAASRDRVLSGIMQRGVANPIVLTGDIHRSLAANVKEDFNDPGSAIIGCEFAGTSVSSGGNGSDMDDYGRAFLAANEHVKFNSAQRGYVRCTVTPESWRADFRALPYVDEPDAEAYTRIAYAVEAGNPGLQKVDENPPRGKVYGPPVTPDYLYETGDEEPLR